MKQKDYYEIVGCLIESGEEALAAAILPGKDIAVDIKLAGGPAPKAIGPWRTKILPNNIVRVMLADKGEMPLLHEALESIGGRIISTRLVQRKAISGAVKPEQINRKDWPGNTVPVYLIDAYNFVKDARATKQTPSLLVIQGTRKLVFLDAVKRINADMPREKDWADTDRMFPGFRAEYNKAKALTRAVAAGAVKLQLTPFRDIFIESSEQELREAIGEDFDSLAAYGKNLGEKAIADAEAGLIRRQYEMGAGLAMSRFMRGIKMEDFKVPKTVYTKGDQTFDITGKVREKLAHYIRHRTTTAPNHRLLSNNRFETTGGAPFSYVTKQMGDKLILLSIQSQIGEHEKDFSVSFNFDAAGMDKMTKFVAEQAKALLIKDAVAEAREEAAETYRRG